MLWKEILIVDELVELAKFTARAQEFINTGRAKFKFNNSDFGPGFEMFGDLPVLQTGIVRVNAGETLQIHIDGNFEISQWAINVPLRECADSVTRFWHTDKKPVRKLHKDGAYWHVDGPYTLISEHVLRTTTLLRIDVPHSVTNNGLHDRYALSLRFRVPPTKFINQ